MSVDRLIAAYLSDLVLAAEPLPAERRTDLMVDVTAHIAEARAAGATSEDDVRQMLKQLGEPRDIVVAASDGLVLVEPQPAAPPQPRFRGREIAVFFLLPFGVYIFLVGWFAGLYLLWKSDRWTDREKWLATFIMPFGYASVQAFATVDLDYTLPGYLRVPAVIALLAAPLVMVVVLARNGRPGRSAQ
ncbi:hypothetical protein ACFVWG_38010 [Kribbella sp. NPDC058245]|uniref:HAAS signaling domain-containing protein n=1 Tax=Kribbella sp. NPDC058245 TaxID=3346399 RepID=UPI0036E4E79F